MRPVVGISQCLDDRGRWRQGRDYLYADQAYARAVADAGGVALHLPLQSQTHSQAEALVERVDALLIPGGDDFLPPTPSPYPTEVRFDPAPARQIDFDTRLLECALARDLPVLGICYGMQLLALLHGGELYYHLPIDRAQASSHQLDEREGRHAIDVTPESRLASILGANPAPVNSLHHQAVRTPGEGLRATAHGADGVIEALEALGPPFRVGVQWHPEKLQGEQRLSLFRALLDAC